MSDDGYDAALVLFEPADTERRCAEARRSTDGRVREYLQTRRPAALVRTDADHAALCDMMVQDVIEWSVTGPVDMTADERGLRRLLSGCVPVAVLVPRTYRFLPAGGKLCDVTWCCLPDGKMVCVDSHLYLFEHMTLRRLSSDGLSVDATHLDHYRMATQAVVELTLWSLRVATPPLDPLCRMLDEAGDVGPVVAAKAVPVAAARTSVKRLVRAHLLLLTCRRRAAAAIARAWCRYEGAPHGPRARFLRDLERGWTPDALHRTTNCKSDPRAAGDGVCTLMGLFASGAAYRTYCNERLAVLRKRLCGARGGADRVQTRRSSLYELDRYYGDGVCDADGVCDTVEEPSAVTDPALAL